MFLTEASLINIGNTVHETVIFFLPSITPSDELKKYRISFNESHEKCLVSGRGIAEGLIRLLPVGEKYQLPKVEADPVPGLTSDSSSDDGDTSCLSTLVALGFTNVPHLSSSTSVEKDESSNTSLALHIEGPASEYLDVALAPQLLGQSNDDGSTLEASSGNVSIMTDESPVSGNNFLDQRNILEANLDAVFGGSATDLDDDNPEEEIDTKTDVSKQHVDIGEEKFSIQNQPLHHHKNFNDDSMYDKSATAPEVSLWAAFASSEKAAFEPISREGVIVAEAIRLIDPVRYFGPESLLALKGSEFREAVTGYVEKVYKENNAFWPYDCYGDDEQYPTSAEDADFYLSSKVDGFENLQKPYLMQAADGDTIINDDKRLHLPLIQRSLGNERHTIGRSKLCIMQSAEDE